MAIRQAGRRAADRDDIDAEKAALGKLVNYTEIPDRDVKARELTEGLRRLRGAPAARIGRVALKRDQRYIRAASQNS